MSLNYSVDYEKLFFLYSLDNPKYLKNFYPGFFSNDEIDSLADLSKKFYLKFSESPSKDQVKVLVEKSAYNEKISKEMIDLIFDTNIKEYDPEWLKKTAQSWITWRNFDKQLINTVEYVKLQNVTPDSVDQIVHHAIDMLREKGVVNFDSNLGLDFFNPSDHIQQTQSKISSGYTWIDRITGGYDPKSLIVWAGETNVGKSIFLANDAANFIKMGYNTAVITAEMSPYKVIKRIGSNLLNIEMGEYDKGSQNVELIKRKLQGVSRGLLPPGKLFIKEFPTSQATVLDIESYLRELEQIQGFKLKAVVIDYINILANYRNLNSENTYMKIKQIAEDLRAIAVRNNWLIVSATQINRQGYASTDISLSHISESAGLSHTCDMIYGIIQDEVMHANNQYWIKILKLRDGDGKGIKCRFDINYNFMRLTETSDIIQTE